MQLEQPDSESRERFIEGVILLSEIRWVYEFMMAVVNTRMLVTMME